MKKEEKTKLTRQRILAAAMEEFGTKGYSASVLNNICTQGAIPKGLVYHNFKGKDDLYLTCVSVCFRQVTEFLKEQDIKDDLEKYMSKRFLYFSTQPLQAQIFFEAMLQPPEALIGEIKLLREEFDQFNRQVYRAALSKIKLRAGVTEDDAMEYYSIIQEMFNGYFSSPAYNGRDFESRVAEHEQKLAKMLDLMLYGIGERRDD